MPKVLFKMSGSIAAYKACAALSALVKEGCEVQVVATQDVFNFVGASTLEGLTGKPVISEIHQPGDMMSHIHLNTWADIVVLCPASANTIAKINHGIADNIVSTLALARIEKKPYLIFPAMNPKMWSAKPTQSNVQRLQDYGYKILTGDIGPVACGDFGEGRLMEPDQIVLEIRRHLKVTDSNIQKPKLLITAGGTSEKLDAVRTFSNTSTGKTGAVLAQDLSEIFDITFVGSKHAINELDKLVHEKRINKLQYESYKDLQNILKHQLAEQDFEAVLHAAAVSDFSPSGITQDDVFYALPLSQKIKTSDTIQVHFSKNPKLIKSLKDWSKNTKVKIVGFKLLEDKTEAVIKENLDKLFTSSDLVVLNFTDEVGPETHKYTIYEDPLNKISFGTNKKQLATDLKDILLKKIKDISDVSNQRLEI